MLNFLLLLSGGYLAGCAVMVYGFATAPRGEETETGGFQLTWCNNSPAARDVSCIWLELGSGGAESLA